MLFRKRYSFQVDQNKDALTQALKDLTNQDHVNKTDIGMESAYSVEFNWNEFIVTRKPEFSERSGFGPDAYIQLVSLSENLTQVNVKIKLSAIWWIVLIFIHLGILGGSLFLPHFRLFGNSIETTWLNRIIFLFFTEFIFNLVIWLFFVRESGRLKQVISQVFGQVV
jgi:hypothetical protein